jgi:hypothetical protein
MPEFPGKYAADIGGKGGSLASPLKMRKGTIARFPVFVGELGRLADSKPWW